MECVHKGHPPWYKHLFTLGFQISLKGLDDFRFSGFMNIMKKEARFFKGLADETRLKILWLLLAKEELCVCNLMAVLGSPSPRLRAISAIYSIRAWCTTGGKASGCITGWPWPRAVYRRSTYSYWRRCWPAARRPRPCGTNWHTGCEASSRRTAGKSFSAPERGEIFESKYAINRI